MAPILTVYRAKVKKSVPLISSATPKGKRNGRFAAALWILVPVKKTVSDCGLFLMGSVAGSHARFKYCIKL